MVNEIPSSGEHQNENKNPKRKKNKKILNKRNRKHDRKSKAEVQDMAEKLDSEQGETHKNLEKMTNVMVGNKYDA